MNSQVFCFLSQIFWSKALMHLFSSCECCTLVLLSGPASYQLKTFEDYILSSINNKQMYMIGSRNVIEHTKPVSLFRFKKPIPPAQSIFLKLKKKFLFMTSMGNMPNTARDIMSIRSCHRNKSLKPKGDNTIAFLKGTFSPPKRAF